jgi:non-ribosomal peptide synthetase component E (peptide arylation enzyme)
LDFGQIIALASEAGLAKQKLPQHIELVDDLPRTASGKVKKDVLRKRIKAQLSAA